MEPSPANNQGPRTSQATGRKPTEQESCSRVHSLLANSAEFADFSSVCPASGNWSTSGSLSASGGILGWIHQDLLIAAINGDAGTRNAFSKNIATCSARMDRKVGFIDQMAVFYEKLIYLAFFP